MGLTPSWPGVHGLATTTDGRKALAGLIAKNAAGVARAGVFPAHANALVTARGDLNVDIGAFQAAAVQFGGPILLTNDGTAQLPVALVSPVSGTNFYVIYAKQNEGTAPGTDGINTVIFGAVLSTSSFAAARASGTRLEGGPTGLPAGAVELGTVQMPTGKASTDASGVTITATHQFTAAAGGVVWLRNSTEQTAWTPADGSHAYRLDLEAFRVRRDGAWKSTAPAEVGYADRGASPADLVVNASSVWQDVTSVTVTGDTHGGEVEVEWDALARNMSGGTSYFEILYRVVLDGVSTGGEVPFAVPGQSGLNPPYRAGGRFRHTPSAGSHTWKLQHFCGLLNSAGTKFASIKVTELG